MHFDSSTKQRLLDTNKRHTKKKVYRLQKVKESLLGKRYLVKAGEVQFVAYLQKDKHRQLYFNSDGVVYMLDAVDKVYEIKE